MAAQTGSIKLSEQRQDGVFKCYRKTIGGHPFYFTQDRQQSERMAMALLAAWSQIQAEGGGSWTREAIADALALAGVKPRELPLARPMPGRQMLYAAIDEYLEDYRLKVSESRYQRQATVMSVLLPSNGTTRSHRLPAWKGPASR